MSNIPTKIELFEITFVEMAKEALKNGRTEVRFNSELSEEILTILKEKGYEYCTSDIFRDSGMCRVTVIYLF